MIKIRKCQKIYKTLRETHCEDRTTCFSDLKIPSYKSSAREIEVDLYNMYLRGEITDHEYTYIFGLICRNALRFGGENFYRV